MNLIEAKEKIKTDGYCDFNLKDFNEEYYNLFLNYKYSSNDSQYLEKFKNIRFDYQSNDTDKVHLKELLGSYQEVNQLKTQLLQTYDYQYMSQLWFYADFDTNAIYNGISLKEVYYSIVNYFYGLPSEDVDLGMQYTCYSEDCFLKDHIDSCGRLGREFKTTIATCAILIYLNEEWDTSWGGNLVLRNDTLGFNTGVSYSVVPEFGKVAIIDLETYDISHMVEDIKGDHNRCTMLSFCTHTNKQIKLL